MTLIRKKPDTQWLISENHLLLRPPLRSDTPQEMWWPTYQRDVELAIAKMERLRGWRFLDSVPLRKEFVKGSGPCCAKILQPAGTPLLPILRPATYQGDPHDTRDADNVVTNQLDGDEKGDLWMTWIGHFWQPGILFNHAEFLENLPGPKQRFVAPENLHPILLEGTNVYDDYFAKHRN